MTKVLVTGAGGMLGSDLLAVLAATPSFTVTAARRADLDLTDPAAVAAAVPGHDVVINAAAWTDVDGAETAEDAATLLNGGAVASLASACAASGARLLHVSTDYVLSGSASSPYPESAPTAPINAYGRSKLVGEQAVLSLLPTSGYVVRTAWLYGEHGRNFAATMLRLAASRETVDVVDDQRGQPTWSLALARQLVALASSSAPAGVYHGTAAGETTWFGFAQAVFSLAGLDPERVRPTTSAAFVRPAARPAYSVLGHDRWAAAGLAPMADWREALADAVSSGAVRAG
ncbi:dTDP-4-dehydrorhamnose reductase [Asanoa siamensis]|uniref:dTDP-4-dehydrorhamnose reductase n=1 Tax=Asanoa siamensis TaxID=926357 RepID=A0ABQ4CYW1_9ACTN|nr:dTDP-4-dehydrorhamnose reductase [Asanoa siamensis]GIF76042.1 NAD(P)-dependent oxidoreductase [Asanoa siamensis]